MIDNNYYPEGYSPLHAVSNWAYVRKLVRAARNGDYINPILVCGDQLLAGTHRLAANNIIEATGNGVAIEVTDLDGIDRPDIVEAMEDGDFELIDELWDRN